MVYILYNKVIQSVLMCYILLKKKYISLLIYNFDDVVRLRGNQNFYLRLFVKGGALQNSHF